MDKIEGVAESIKQLLLYFYSPDHPYIHGINRVLNCPNPNSKGFSEAVGQMGWSGMGSFIDSVFCDLSSDFSIEEITKADKELKVLMYALGEHAIKVDPSTPNNQAISNMLDIWKNRI